MKFKSLIVPMVLSVVLLAGCDNQFVCRYPDSSDQIEPITDDLVVEAPVVEQPKSEADLRREASLLRDQWWQDIAVAIKADDSSKVVHTGLINAVPRLVTEDPKYTYECIQGYDLSAFVDLGVKEGDILRLTFTNDAGDSTEEYICIAGVNYATEYDYFSDTTTNLDITCYEYLYNYEHNERIEQLFTHSLKYLDRIIAPSGEMSITEWEESRKDDVIYSMNIEIVDNIPFPEQAREFGYNP